MNTHEKLEILTNSAKYDVACTSSGVKDRPGKTVACGVCHAFSADGRCITLLKILLSNECIYNCKYCVNRTSNDVPRTTFTPAELAELTVEFYRRNYIEGLFLSSGVVKNPDYTMEQMIKALELLRHTHNFWGYIHAKTIPGASPEMVHRLGLLADRLSVNIELPSEASLKLLAPDKTRAAVLAPMGQIRQMGEQNTRELQLYRSAPKFAAAGQATQMIIGASPETDYQIIKLSSAMYEKYALRRVFFSAYVPTSNDSLLPSMDTNPPLLREHRLYQADWLMRFYKFKADEILSPETPDFNPYLDPKCNWALNNLHLFPIDVNKAGLADLLRIPGVGPTSAERIVTARRNGRLALADLRRIGVVLKRAQYFIVAADHLPPTSKDATVRALLDPGAFNFGVEQLTIFSPTPATTLHLPPAQKAERNALEEVVEGLVAGM
ncbi:MAG: putative DNA modification/repair radical SAM protein [Oscillospiraceae bacterium]|nr:putative DNA modification/repair radical SAM protein [Oscillospiraceae bacterium]